MTIATHKCENCGAFYGCICRKEHWHKSPAYDCGKCTKGAETVMTDALPEAPFPVRYLGQGQQVSLKPSWIERISPQHRRRWKTER